MLDEFIEKCGGYTLIAVGIVALAVSVAGYLFPLPPQFSLRPELTHVIGLSRWTLTSQMFWDCGLLCILWGLGIAAYFRRDWRAEDTTSHLTSAEAVKGAMERLRQRRRL